MAGCQKDGAAANTAAIDRSNFNEPGTFPLVKNKTELTFVLAGQESITNNVFTDWYEEKTNVRINWVSYPGDQYRERVTLAFISGEKIDYIMGTNDSTPSPYGMTDLLKLAQQGLIIPIQDLIETDTIYMKEGFARYPGIREMITSIDGSIYGTPTFTETLHSRYYGKLWVNKVFLDNLNIDVPTTIEDFEKMLIAFRDRDANGNGDPRDEIPLAGGTGGFESALDAYLISAFIYNDGGNRLYLDNGKVTAAYMQPRFRDGLRYMHRLYTQDLIDPDSFMVAGSEIAKKNSQKYESVIGAIKSPHHGNIGTRAADEPVRWLDYIPIPPLKGPDGTQITRFDYAIYSGGPKGFVPATSSSPALVLRYWDWFYSEEGMTNGYYGPEGIGWVKETDPGATGENGAPAKIRLLLPVDGKAVIARWGNNFGNYRTEQWRSYTARPAMDEPGGLGLERFLYYWTEKNYVPYGAPVSMLIPPLDIYIPLDDLSTKARIQGDINTYVNECVAKFTTGAMNIETDWERFQGELKNLGIDRLLSMIQTAYDASAFAKKQNL